MIYLVESPDGIIHLAFFRPNESFKTTCGRHVELDDGWTYVADNEIPRQRCEICDNDGHDALKRVILNRLEAWKAAELKAAELVTMERRR